MNAVKPTATSLPAPVYQFAHGLPSTLPTTYDSILASLARLTMHIDMGDLLVTRLTSHEAGGRTVRVIYTLLLHNL